MFPSDDQIEHEYFDKATAYWCGIVQGAGIGVIGTIVLGAASLFLITIF